VMAAEETPADASLRAVWAQLGALRELGKHLAALEVPESPIMQMSDEHHAARPAAPRSISDRTASDSRAQLDAEPLILRSVSEALGGVKLAARRLRLGEGAYVVVDGVAPDESILVEVFAHLGRLKGGQVHKVAQDALKLITLARSRPASKLILAFGDREAADCVRGGSWLAEALRAWGVEVHVAGLDEDVRAGLRLAQERQLMVNPPSDRGGSG
jgi:hypothetical protein